MSVNIFSVFTNASCELEKKVSSCCDEKKEANNNCCQHKQFFKKLTVEGFTANKIELKPIEKIVLKDYFFNSFSSVFIINQKRNIKAT